MERDGARCVQFRIRRIAAGGPESIGYLSNQQVAGSNPATSAHMDV